VTIRLFAVFVFSLSLPELARADALQQQVLAAAKTVTSRDFAFTQTLNAQRTGKPANNVVQHYDPRRGVTAWTLVKVDGRAPTAKESADAAKQFAKAQVPSYARIAEWFGAPATRIATTPTSVTYRFASLPKGVIKMGSYDASANTSAEAIVNTSGRIPFVERTRFSSNTSFRMMMVVKVERFIIVTANRLLPDGRPVPASVVTEFAGSFMGSAQTMKMQMAYSDVQAVRP
jgi:hypothetical protein